MIICLVLCVSIRQLFCTNIFVYKIGSFLAIQGVTTHINNKLMVAKCVFLCSEYENI